ncbi:hypothetical protein RIF29_22587 [Crotalaria pallida]|uniref:F-box domain-containing protein n=1 Tax=Crotalaria pallida TaxID=3830 RepID=A0AAN9I9G6_CROPI
MTTPSAVQPVKKAFPLDVEFEIQLRLPPKALARFKCVSKSWNNQISDPVFQETYHIRSKNRINVLFHKRPVNLNMRNQMLVEEWGSFNTKTLTIGNNFNTYGVRVSHLSMVTPQGMICFLGYKNNDYNDAHVYLYSLTSQLFLELPNNSASGFYVGRIVGSGIGYIPSTKKFKIVLLFVRNIQIHQPLYNCQVIEIKNNSLMGDERGSCFSNWRLIDGHINDLVDCFETPVIVESTLHWKTWYKNFIISFDLESEQFRRIEYPTNGYDPSMSTSNHLLHLVDLQGKLGFLTLRDPRIQDASLWRLKQDDDDALTWERMYTFSLGGSFHLEPLRPLFFRNEEIIVLYTRGCVMFHNLEKGSFKMARINEAVNCSVVGVYYESLSNE